MSDKAPRSLGGIQGVESLDSLLRYLAPTEQSTTLNWFRQHARNTDGRPYSHNLFPHLGAPGGPCDAFDDYTVRKIWLQFASRLGKTYFGQCCVMKKADTNPGPMMLASSVEKTALEVTERTYKIIEHSPKVSWQLRPKHRRRQSCIDFDACQCQVAWSRSVSTLADKEVEFGHGNEIDKWEHASTSTEADPLKLFTDRFKNRPHHKILLESTPAVKTHSRVEAGRLNSWNCEYYVPCPHCDVYQPLKMSENDVYYLQWEKLPNGRSDREMARRTAFYQCAHCEGKIEDHHRPMMMRLGVWVPEGCKVNHAEAKRVATQRYQSTIPGTGVVDFRWEGWSKAPWIVGTPLRDGPEAGYKLSSLYALSLGWGDIAAEFVGCYNRPQDLRNFINQWLAETWEHAKRKDTWENLGIRFIDNSLPRGIVPSWAQVLTCGIDRQGEDVTSARFPWVVDAWGSQNRCHTVDYGVTTSFDELLSQVISKNWLCENQSENKNISFTLMDSGFKPDGVYEFCRKCQNLRLDVWPSKGSNVVMDSDFRYSILGDNTSMPGMALFTVDTVRSQLWIDSQFDRTTLQKYTICSGSLFDHQDFLEQLINDAVVDSLDQFNNVRQSWERLDTRIPNDFRDCRRYARVAFLIKTGGRELQEASVQQPLQPVKRKVVAGGGVFRSDGTPY